MQWIAIFLIIAFATYEPHYKWVKSSTPSEKVYWSVVTIDEVKKQCGWKPDRGFTQIAGCAVQLRESNSCYIYSYLDEQKAKFIYDLDGMSIYDHEMKHCEGWRH